jgi:acyl carrier protein
VERAAVLAGIGGHSRRAGTPAPQSRNAEQEAAMATTYDKLIDLLVNQFQVEPDKVQPGATFEDLEMDSLFLVEFLLIVENDFGIKISEDVASPKDTIETAAKLIDHQLGAAVRP